jgi:serine/threonine protein kinase
MQALKSKAIVDHRFEIVEMLGAGGMGIVYKAIQLELGRTVALKFLLPHLLEEEETLARFKIEAAALASLSHRNISLFYAYGVWHGRAPYIAMEYLDAPNLSELLVSEDGQITWRRTLGIVRQICEAIAHAHNNGIIHRDLKPSNVFVISDDAGDRVKVSDFGLAKIIDDDAATRQKLTATGFTVGSPHYMSPEQAHAQPITEATDVYSLGCIMYECLFGRPPFDADTPAEILFQQSSYDLRLPDSRQSRDLPNGLLAVLRTALAKDPAERFSSMQVMREAIDAVINESRGAKDSKPKFAARARTVANIGSKPIKRIFVGRVLAIAFVCVFGTALLIYLNYDSLQFARQDFLLKSARERRDVYEVAKIELREISMCERMNREELKKQLLNQLAADAPQAASSTAFQQDKQSEKREFVKALVFALMNWSPTSGEQVEQLAGMTQAIEIVDPDVGRVFASSILVARKPFSHRADLYAVKSLQVALSLLVLATNAPYRQEIIGLLKRAAEGGSTLDGTLPVYHAYCIEPTETRRVDLQRRLDKLDQLPSSEKNSVTRTMVSYGDQALAAYYTNVGDQPSVDFYRRAIANEMEMEPFREPLIAVMQLCLGHALRQVGKADEAFKEYQHVIDHGAAAQSPMTIACAQLSQADLLADRGDWRKALALYYTVARKDELAHTAHVASAVNQSAIANAHIFGEAHFVKPFQDEAEAVRADKRKYFEKAMHVAEVYTVLGDSESALRTLDQLLLLSDFPYWRDATQTRRAHLYAERDDELNCLSAYRSAIDATKKLGKSNSGLNLHRLLLQIEYARMQRAFGHFDESNRVLLTAMKEIEALPASDARWQTLRTTYLDMGSLLAAQGDTKAAVEWLQKGWDLGRRNRIANGNNYPDEFICAGIIAMLQGNFTEAETQLRLGLSHCETHDPDYPRAVAALAQVRLRSGDRGGAKRLFTEAVSHWKVSNLLYPMDTTLPEYHEAVKTLKSLS